MVLEVRFMAVKRQQGIHSLIMSLDEHPSQKINVYCGAKEEEFQPRCMQFNRRKGF